MLKHMIKSMLRLTLILAISSFIFCSCQVKNNTQKAQDNISQEDKSVKSVEKEDIPFIVAEKYFVKNTVNSINNPKITTQENFDNIFGAGAVMGKDGLPTKIDFDKQYVIAVINPETEYNTTITPVNLQKDSNNLVFTYKVDKGERQTHTIRPCLILIVNSNYGGEIILKEI